MIDPTDQYILEELKKNSRISMKELGSKVHLTGQAVAGRITKLVDSGVIDAFTINLNHERLGSPILGFLTIYLHDISHQPYLTFIKTQSQVVNKQYKISGEGCYLLECRFSSTQHLAVFLDSLTTYATYKLSLVIDELDA